MDFLKFHPRFSGNRDSGANLKKVLALVLAFACAFTMFAGAAFTDQADIKVDSEVVDTLVSLGIVEGFEDGSFQPNATVTRAQMAKMIYVLRTGKSDASAYNDDKTSFTDIGSHWARGYIKYCQSLGIIAGKSNTIFAPNATVTAQEAAKMLLVTLGYNAEKAGLVGANWASKTNALADENGLLEDVNTSFTSACPRQYAAQLIYNAIDTPTVVWRDDAYTNTNYKDEDNQTIGEKYMGLESDTGMLVAAGKVGLDGQKYDEDQIALAHVNKNDVGKDDGDIVTLSDVTGDYSALLGQHVKVLHKVTKTGVNNSKDKVYGVYATDKNGVLFTGISKDLDTVSGEKKINVNGKKYDVDSKLTVYTYSLSKEKFESKDQDISTAAKIATAVKALNDDAFKISVISNDDDSKIDTIVKVPVTFSKITATTSTTVTYKVCNNKGGTTSVGAKLNFEDDTPEMYDGFKKDDYVFVGTNLHTGNTAFTKAEKISGKVSASKKNEIKVDGSWYKLTHTDKKDKVLDTNKNVELYVCGNYAYYVDGSVSGNLDTLLLKSVEDTYSTLNGGVSAKVIFADGTEKIINIEGWKHYDSSWTSYTDEAGTLKAQIGAIPTNALYIYDEDDGNYTLTDISKAGKSGTDYEDFDIADSSVNYKDKANTLAGDSVNDDAVIYLQYKSAGDTKYKVITGKDLANYDDMTGTGSSIALSDDDGVAYAFLNLGTSNTTSNDTLYGVVTKAVKQRNADNKEVVYLEMVTADGEKTGDNAVETDKTDVNAFSKGDIVKFDGSYTQAKNVEVISNATKAESDGKTAGYAAVAKDGTSSSKSIQFKNNKLYTKDGAEIAAADNGTAAKTYGAKVSDTVVIYLNSVDWEAGDAQDWMEAELNSGDTAYKANVFAVINKDDELDLLVIGTEDNEIRSSANTDKAVEIAK